METETRKKSNKSLGGIICSAAKSCFKALRKVARRKRSNNKVTPTTEYCHREGWFIEDEYDEDSSSISTAVTVLVGCSGDWGEEDLDNIENEALEMKMAMAVRGR